MKNQSASVTGSSLLMLFVEVLIVDSENRTKHVHRV